MGFGLMGSEAVGLWVVSTFGSRKGRLYIPFDLNRLFPFAVLAGLGFEMERMELISFV